MKIVFSSQHHALLLLASMCILPFSLLAYEQNKTEIYLSEVELQEIFNNPKRSYVYVGKAASNMADVINEICKLDKNQDSFVWGLKKHIDQGFVIGNYDGVAQALEQAEAVLLEQRDALNADQAEELSNALDNVVEQVIEEKLNLDADSLSYLKDSVKSCCGNDDKKEKAKHCHGLRLLVIKEKIDVLGKAKFRDDVTFYDDVHFRDNVTFEDGSKIDGDLFVDGVLNAVQAVVGCDFTVGCNLNMNESISSGVGNIIKDGVHFIHNFGTDNTFVGINAGNFTMAGNGANVGFGVNALSANTTGELNTGAGFNVLNAVTTGSNNAAFGNNALENVTTGSNNVALGSFAGQNATVASSGNIYINNLGAAESDTIRIGTAQTRAFVAGVRGVSTGVADAVAVLIDSAGQFGTINSSRRFKHDIAEMGVDSASIYQLNPVTFVYNGDASKTTQYGLIAEEVDQVFPGIVVKDADGQPETVQYHVLPVLLLNEVQKQQACIKDLAERVARLEESAPAA